MADHDEAQDYKANGPTDVGFRTDGTGIENGVVAFGKQVGVRGISVGGDEGSFFCGVSGESQLGIGVQGQSRSGPGVIGISDFADGVSGSGGGQGVGVKGTSESTDGIVGSTRGEGRFGVLGFNTLLEGTAIGVGGSSHSRDGIGVLGFADRGVGVKGASESNDGIVGTSSGEGRSGVFGFNELSRLVTFGVSGRSDSPDGAGVNGFSPGYGGHFKGGRAPLRLQPSDNTSGPPTTGNHQKGELFVDNKGDLFLCKGDGTPGTWFRVQLVPA